MLKSDLLHPEILSTLGASGHGSRVVIADGNYPYVTQSNKEARVVYLNLAPGIVKAPRVLSVINQSIVIETAKLMRPEDRHEPRIFQEFKEILEDTEPDEIGRFEFYEAARDDQVSLVIATGEERTFGNVILTLGVRRGGES